MSGPKSNSSTNKEVLEKFSELYLELFEHDGYGDVRVELKFKNAGQKEVIIHCGRQYRFFVDFKNVRNTRSELNRGSQNAPQTTTNG